MPGRMSDMDTHAILNNRFGAVATSPAATYYLGLSTTAPASDGTGVTEPVSGATANGYARLAVANNTTNFPNAANRQKSNGAAFTMGTATADWGVITHFVLFDNLTGGALRAYGPLDAPVTIVTGDTPTFPIGSIVITSPNT